MLQEATKALNTAFNNSFIKKLSQYLHDCVREEVKSSTFRNLKGDKDNKWIFLNEEESLLTSGEEYLRLEGSDPKLTELMIQSENNQKDKYLIYGYMFLVGKNAKSRKQNEFLTPLLYMPCRLERNGVNINCILQDEVLSLNTGALAALMKKRDDEDEIDLLLEGILDAVPELPITQEKMDIFLTTLKSVVPDVVISENRAEYVAEDNVSKDFYVEKSEADSEELFDEDEKSEKEVVKVDKVSVTYQSAIILTKRPAVTAGVLHELIQIGERPSGYYRETALNVINEEYVQSKEKSVIIANKKEEKEFFPVTPLSLSDSQEKVIKNIENNKFIAVQGPPGTGKSQTIVNLVAHLIANGKTVLVASRMDKAVDVVADRLNNLGAPFLALRAGRLNYQRQLSYQLQDLLSGKVDLDEDAEDALFADVDDMKKLLSSIQLCEQKCEEIINLEKEWKNVNDEKVKKAKFIESRIYINEVLSLEDIKKIEECIATIEKNSEKSNFFTSISNYTSAEKLKKILKVNMQVNDDTLTALKCELSLAKLESKERDIELRIQKKGNLNLLMEEIHELKSKQFKMACDILKNQRRDTLKGLLRDQVKCQRLKIHAKSLVERKKRLQNNILEGEDFKPLLEAFPCWCVTTYAVSESLPLKPGMFDVAIIDEASQCDIASCFPILYRAKKAVIVGDDKQLPHLSFLEKAKEQSFLNQYGIPDKYQLMWRFRTNSMFDLADYYSMNSVMLDEHFRSLPPVIDFSNKEFYGDRIKVMRNDASTDKVLELVEIPDGKVDMDATRNMPEIEEVVKKLHEIIVDDERVNPDNPVSIGIISPFRAQVDQLKISVTKVLSDYMLKKHKVEIGTAHTFQGDEKDIILLSWTFANNSYVQSLTFLQKPNLFNVAITRAKNKAINFLSRDISRLPEGHFRNYISYLKEYGNKYEAIANHEFDENNYKNSFEKEVAETFRKAGHEVKAGVEIAGLSADLIVDNKVIVEIDGVEDNVKSKISNMKKQAILERSGFGVKRITYRAWKYSQIACIEQVTMDD